MPKNELKLILILTSNIFLVLFCGQGGGRNNESSTPITPQQFYSANDPGEWASMAEDHPPRIEFSKSKKKDNVLVYLILKNPDENHYIEEIGILDKDGKVIDKVQFPRKKQSSYQGYFTLGQGENLSNYRGYARCSQHDLWVTPLVEARKFP